MQITKTFAFESAHHLPHHEGKCKNLHGHNWKVKVSVLGFPIEDLNSPEHGMIMDYKHLKEIVQPQIDRLDHKNLNGIISNPTCENLTKWFGDNLTQVFEKEVEHSQGRIYGLEIEIHENDNSSCKKAFALFSPTEEDFDTTS